MNTTTTTAPPVPDRPHRGLFGRWTSATNANANGPNNGMSPNTSNHQGYTTGTGAIQQQRGGFMTCFVFSRWFRLHAVDLLTMAAMGAIGLGVYEAHPGPTRSLPVQQVDGTITYPEFGYPLRKNIIPIYLAALLSFIIPFVIFVLFQLRTRSFEAFLGTTM